MFITTPLVGGADCHLSDEQQMSLMPSGHCHLALLPVQSMDIGHSPFFCNYESTIRTRESGGLEKSLLVAKVVLGLVFLSLNSAHQ